MTEGPNTIIINEDDQIHTLYSEKWSDVKKYIDKNFLRAPKLMIRRCKDRPESKKPRRIEIVNKRDMIVETRDCDDKMWFSLLMGFSYTKCNFVTSEPYDMSWLARRNYYRSGTIKSYQVKSRSQQKKKGLTKPIFGV